MDDISTYFQSLLTRKNVQIATNRKNLLEQFINNETNITLVRKIIENENSLMGKWKIETRIRDVVEQPVVIPNATVGKPYEAFIDFEKLNWNDLSYSTIDGLEEVGLLYDNEAEIIKGIPAQSGDIKIKFKFRLKDEPKEADLHEKYISLIINPDPKTLWKKIDSDKTDRFWKEDEVTQFENLGSKHIVVSSKRGRSHANVGSFRDDDFAFKHLEKTGWSIVAVSDGAGSSKSSRYGSMVACNGILEYFSESVNLESLSMFDILVKEYSETKTEEIQKKLNLFVYENLGRAALSVYKKLENFANNTGMPIKELHATLIFALIKKYEFGYAILSFGVGDCPIGLLSKDMSSINLMNWLDVGEFGGGTRFITMPEIFQNEKFATRFNFKLVDDFSYLFLMTDGIYDPKFVVEANLEKVEKWKELLEDLQGKNEDNIRVELSSDNAEIASQLSNWMDFWSPGNHDDRTLAIIF